MQAQTLHAGPQHFPTRRESDGTGNADLSEAEHSAARKLQPLLDHLLGCSRPLREEDGEVRALQHRRHPGGLQGTKK